MSSQDLEDRGNRVSVSSQWVPGYPGLDTWDPISKKTKQQQQQTVRNKQTTTHIYSLRQGSCESSHVLVTSSFCVSDNWEPWQVIVIGFKILSIAADICCFVMLVHWLFPCWIFLLSSVYFRVESISAVVWINLFPAPSSLFRCDDEQMCNDKERFAR